MARSQRVAYGSAAAATAVFALLIAAFAFRAPRVAVTDAFRLVFSDNASSTSAAEQGALGTESGRFSDPSIGFSFAVPTGFRAVKNLSDNGETILVQTSSASSSVSDTVEVYVRSYNGSPTDITAKNIEAQAGLTVQNSVAVSIAGAQGLGFLDASSNPPLYEAWFVHNGYLFQAMAWEKDAPLLKSILASWRFN